MWLPKLRVTFCAMGSFLPGVEEKGLSGVIVGSGMVLGDYWAVVGSCGLRARGKAAIAPCIAVDRTRKAARSRSLLHFLVLAVGEAREYI